MDFTLAKYEELCRAVSNSNYLPINVLTYIESYPQRCIIFRHDVDREPEKALKMAELEYKYGISSTYYFRMVSNVFIPKILAEVKDMGHEIGYHYEVLDKVKGDFESAIRLFSEEIKDFEKYNVKTICMHGNPLSKWTNKDLWEEYNFEDFGIIGEPYLSIDYSLVAYFTDTGRRWNSKSSVKDVVDCNTLLVKSTNGIIDLIEEGKINQICILTHPNRWNDNGIDWMKELFLQNLKNVGKFGLKQLKT